MSLQEYIEQRAELMKTINSHKDFKYSGFEELILDCGKLMKPSATQEAQGLPKSCYYNCQELIDEEKGLIYVEGYALSKEIDFFPFAHAWLINDLREVIEPTWEQPGIEYFGVPLATEWVKSIIDARQLKGQDDLSIFEGNYLESFSLLKYGLPKEAYVELPFISATKGT